MSNITPEEHARFAAEFNPDVSVEKIAQVYAESFLAAGDATKQPLNGLIEEFESLFEDVFAKQPRFESVLASTMINPDDKLGILDRTLKSAASPVLLNFLKVLARHSRLDILRDIRHAIGKLYDERLGRIPVTVTTASPLAPETMESLFASLKKLTGGEPQLKVLVDPEVIGGIVIRVGDTIYDASILTKLKNVRQQMIDRSAHEIQSRRDRFRNTEGN